MVKESIKSLHNKCQRSHGGWDEQPWVFVQIRKVSIYLTWLLLQTSLKPNTITLIGIACSVFAAFAFVLGDMYFALLFIALFVLLDFSDGEVSRYRNLTSKEGSYLDKVYIFAGHPIIVAGAAIYQIQKDPTLISILLGFSSVLFVYIYCMVVEYCEQITHWRHLKKLTANQNFHGELEALVKKHESSLVGVDANSVAPVDLLSVKIYRSLKSTLSAFDFPYIFLILGFAVLTEALLPVSITGSVSPIAVFIYVYGISLPVFTVIFLFKNLAQHRVDKNFSEFASVLNKAIKQDSRGKEC